MVVFAICCRSLIGGSLACQLIHIVFRTIFCKFVRIARCSHFPSGLSAPFSSFFTYYPVHTFHSYSMQAKCISSKHFLDVCDSPPSYRSITYIPHSLWHFPTIGGMEEISPTPEDSVTFPPCFAQARVSASLSTTTGLMA